MSVLRKLRLTGFLVTSVMLSNAKTGLRARIEIKKGAREFMIECTILLKLTIRGGRYIELQNPKRPTDYRDWNKPFFEGDRSRDARTGPCRRSDVLKKDNVCAANNYRQKNGGLERTHSGGSSPIVLPRAELSGTQAGRVVGLS